MDQLLPEIFFKFNSHKIIVTLINIYIVDYFDNRNPVASSFGT